MSMPKSYLIVGSGVFGASTALYLIQRYPDASIILIDRDAYNAPTRVAASWDWNKVIRADYSDALYTELALEAQHLWRTDQTWSEFYHESGVVWISPTSWVEQVQKSYKHLGVATDIRTSSVEEARTLFEGLFADSDYTDVREVLVNRKSGWAEAKEALQNTIETAIGLGVKYITAEVATLQFEQLNEERRCSGIKTALGEIITAENVILCTGAFTPTLLMNSAPHWTNLHAGERIIAAAVTEAIAPVNAQHDGVLATMPVGINFNPTDRGYDVGGLPLPAIKAVKYWGQITLQNTVEHPITKELISMPPLQANYGQWDVPEALKDDVRQAPKSLFGSKEVSLSLEKFRICWEALTPSEDFIVSPHSGCDGLYIATCGSFHGFKFLPVLGKYVVEMLNGGLSPSLRDRWAWDRELPLRGQNGKRPEKELKDFF